MKVKWQYYSQLNGKKNKPPTRSMLWMFLLLKPNFVWLIIDSYGLNSSVPVGEVCANDQGNAASIGFLGEVGRKPWAFPMT
jgi:hypothetical protein